MPYFSATLTVVSKPLVVHKAMVSALQLRCRTIYKLNPLWFCLFPVQPPLSHHVWDRERLNSHSLGTQMRGGKASCHPVSPCNLWAQDTALLWRRSEIDSLHCCPCWYKLERDIIPSFLQVKVVIPNITQIMSWSYMRTQFVPLWLDVSTGHATRSEQKLHYLLCFITLLNTLWHWIAPCWVPRQTNFSVALRRRMCKVQRNWDLNEIHLTSINPA